MTQANVEGPQPRRALLRLLGREAPAAIVGLLAVGLAIVFFTLPPPTTVLSATANSETLSVKVSNPQAAAFVLRGARDALSEACLPTIVVEPDFDSEITYLRQLGGPLTLSVTGKSSWRTDTQQIGGSDELAIFRLDPLDETCKPDPIVRIPTNGVLEIGAEPVDVVDTGHVWSTLISGDIRVYGRALSAIGPLTLNFGPFAPDSLYLADSSPLPAGSRLTGAQDSNGAPARWWGFAQVDFRNAEKLGIDVEATTNARKVFLFAPAPSAQAAAKPDMISLSTGARLAGDPNLRWVATLSTIMLAVVSLLGAFFRTRDP